MKVTYTGQKEAFTEIQKKKVDLRFAKLGKLVERKGEKLAHVTLTSTRHMHKAEVTFNFHDHPVAAVGEAAEEFHAVIEAVERAEKQTQKLRDKWRNGTRGSVAKKIKDGALAGVLAQAGGTSQEQESPAIKVFKVRNGTRKPMTVDEALLELSSDGRPYLVYRDAEREALSVLIRRKDGHYDLIEA